MDIRFVSADDEKATDAALSAAAAAAAADGIALAGTLQPFDPDRAQEKCHIVLSLLPDGELRDISFDIGAGIVGCRLNPEALEDAALVVEGRIATAQALVVNKFGKQEAAGKGLVTAIGMACEAGLPVLVGVSPAYRAAFLAFADGGASELPADKGAILDWLSRACRKAAA